MAVLVGIDEAGFGPLLGPLVISSCSFSLRSELIKSDLWQVLKRSVSAGKKHIAGRLLVADSKKVYSKSLGIKHLERTVLTVLRCLDKEPATLAELLELLCPDCLERLGDYPWYKDAESRYLSLETADRAIASSVLADDLAQNGIEMLDVQSCCLDVAYYNKMVEAVKNKARVLFTATSQLIKKAHDNSPGDDLHIIIDRQGGRMRYRKGLQLMFPEMDLRILHEGPTASSYELQDDGRAMRIHFIVGADRRYLPVSLASMVSKYLRELLVDSINRYFAGCCADLKPTAGYWKDGLRFIEELKTNFPHVLFESEQLIRCR